MKNRLITTEKMKSLDSIAQKNFINSTHDLISSIKCLFYVTYPTADRLQLCVDSHHVLIVAEHELLEPARR